MSATSSSVSVGKSDHPCGSILVLNTLPEQQARRILHVESLGSIRIAELQHTQAADRAEERNVHTASRILISNENVLGFSIVMSRLRPIVDLVGIFLGRVGNTISLPVNVWSVSIHKTSVILHVCQFCDLFICKLDKNLIIK